MDMREYQRQALETAIYDERDALIYTALGLVGEAGEVANKVKKTIRDNSGQVDAARAAAIAAEVGDVLWYAAALSAALGLWLDDVAAANLGKLRDRAKAGRLAGDGDER